ncbi:MAG: AraC family transcriptional regulator [Phaeodactylibacter sp.]|nr:AraC family transcriptional regulator [Phaeodactylibacter sp.]MCB9264895.1 AraC family transcriptional regulator [Lewinellaceae bacterium]MCB9291074.1 AraC family transcriptional regulator [Lewinellaceae bacterium]
MTLKFYTPPPPLCNLVSLFTYYKGYQPGHCIDRFLPDGNVELVIDLTDFPKNVYHNETLAVQQSFSKAWISGLRKEFISIHAGQDAEMFVITFKKGAARGIVGMPLTELTEQVIEGDRAFGRPILLLREALLEAESPKAKMAAAERHLLSMAGNKLLPNPFVQYAVGQILLHPRQLSLEKLSQKVGYSQKHLIQLFKEHVGLPPKAFLRIIRFQNAIAEIEQRGSIEWSHLALDCGYYDQAHFIRDFKRFSGFTPEEYLKRKNGVLNYVPVG